MYKFDEAYEKAINKAKDRVIQEAILRHNFDGVNATFYGEVKHERLLNEDGYDMLHFLYFETVHPKSSMKRYHQLVYSSMFFILHYENSNVIDRDKGYGIEDVKERFTNFLSYHLKLMQK